VQRVLLVVAFVALILVDLSAVSQTLMMIGLAGIFGAVGHGAMWLPAVAIALTLTAALLWLTAVVWRAIRSTSTPTR
jgi:hypothetical protein